MSDEADLRALVQKLRDKLSSIDEAQLTTAMIEGAKEALPTLEPEVTADLVGMITPIMEGTLEAIVQGLDEVLGGTYDPDRHSN